MPALAPPPPTLVSGRRPGLRLAVAALALAAACVNRGSGPEATPALTAPAITAPARLTAGQAGYWASVPAQPGATYAWTLSNGTLLSSAEGSSVRFTAGTDLARPATLACTTSSGAFRVQSTLQVPVQAGPLIQGPDVSILHQGTDTLATLPVPGASYHWTVTGGRILDGQGTPRITLWNGSGPAADRVRLLTQAPSPADLEVTLATTAGDGHTESTSLAIPVREDDDDPPAGLVFTPAGAVATVGQDLALITNDSSGGSIGSYRIDPPLPDGLVLDPDTGFISGRPTTPAAARAYQVTATGAVLPATTTATVTLAVAAAPFAYDPASVTGHRNVAITPLVPVLAGGAPASHFAVTPALPAGIALDPATGILSGTPTGLSDPAVYTVTADTRDGAGAATVTLAVAESAPAPFSYGAAPVTARLGSALAGLAPAFADGGGPATGFAINPALPAGLTFSTATGVLAGTPTTPSAAAVYTVTASNDAGTRSATLTLAVAAGGPGPFTYGQGTLTAQVGYALAGPVPAFTGAGGRADSFSISPAPPAGLAFDTATGALSGTPGAAMAATDYTVTATNSDGSSTGTLTLAVTAATSYPRFAYVGQNDNSLAIYTVEPTTRQLRILGLADLGTLTPSLLAASPDNRLLFMADQTNGFLLTFTLDPATGSPTRVPQAVLSLPGTPVQLLAGPSGTHVFVACQTRSGATVTGGSVAAFRVDSGGFLSPAAGLAPGALAAGIGPASMVVDPQGNHLVLADTANQVRALAIDANGGLTPAGAVLAGFPSPPVLAAKPAGGAVCILSATGSGSAWDLAVDTYALGAGGLTPLALGTPLAQGYPQAALFDASGAQLLVSEATGPDPADPQHLEAFTLDAGGGFASRGSLPLGSDTRAVLAEPTGHQVYALSATDDAVTLVRRTAGTGGLTRAGQVATRSGPLALALVSGALAPVHQPRFAYSFNPGNHTISGFAVDAASGALTPVAPAMPADAATDRIALHPSGTFLFQYGAASTTILASAIAADGTLSNPVSSPLPATASTGPGGFAVDPTGDYAAVTLVNDGSPHLLVYRLDHTTGGLSGLSSDNPISLDPAGSMIAFDPLDRFLYLLSENQIKAHRFDWRTGVDTVGGTADDVRPSGMSTAQAVAMTVDPTGRTVRVAVGDAGSGAVVTLVPDPTSGWPRMGSTHLGSGAGTRGLAMDPLAAYLYAACGDPAGGTPSQVFSWWLDADQALHEQFPIAGGGLQDPALPSLAPGMSGVSVDPSGTFLYQVNGATGAIQAYRIDRATGALAPAGVPDVTAGPTAQPLLFVDQLQ